MNIHKLPQNKTYLVDMDGVLTNYYGQFLIKWKKAHPQREYFNEDELKTHDLDESYPKKYKQDIEIIVNAHDFFESLPPIKGAIKGIQKLAEKNKVYICTAPSIHNIYCAHGKTMWIRKHLGKEWLRRTVISKDKTIVQGDYLIDDKPHITGANTPVWEQIIYDQPYNQGEDQLHKKRMTWIKGLFKNKLSENLRKI